MRDTKSVEHLLENLFCLMPQVPILSESSKESSNKSSTTKSSKSSQVTMFTEEPHLNIKGKDFSIPKAPWELPADWSKIDMLSVVEPIRDGVRKFLLVVEYRKEPTVQVRNSVLNSMKAVC